jgi:hypothetical protein
MSKSQMKTKFIKGIVHFEFIPQGQTVNHVYYVEILKWLGEAVHRKRLKLWPNNCVFHHDSVPANKQLLAQKSII